MTPEHLLVAAYVAVLALCLAAMFTTSLALFVVGSLLVLAAVVGGPILERSSR